MSRAIIKWLLELREDDELRDLAKLTRAVVAGFRRTEKAPRNGLIQGLGNLKKTTLLIKELNEHYVETPNDYIGHAFEELNELALREHHEIPVILIALLGSAEPSDHELASKLFMELSDKKVLSSYEQQVLEKREQLNRENNYKNTIKEFKQELQTLADNSKVIEEQQKEFYANLELFKTQYQEEKTAWTLEKEVYILKNRELAKHNDAMLLKITEIEEQNAEVNKKCSQLQTEIAEMILEKKALEARITEFESNSAPITSITTNSQTRKEAVAPPRMVLVGRTATEKLLGASTKIKFVAESDVVDEILCGFEQVLLATFDLPYATRRRITKAVQDKVLMFDDRLELKSYLNQEAL